MRYQMNFEDGNHGFQAGIINGPVHPIFHQTAERPETPPHPSCYVPFRRDPAFVERDALLQQIDKTCSQPASRVALVGLSGVGKSQLAIEHCYRTFRRSPETWVFWARAGDNDLLEQSFRDIADILKLRGRRQPQTDILKLVCDWLRNIKNGKWLLVIDNFDTSPSSTEQASQALEAHQSLPNYLPQTNNGSLLLTSRNKRSASELVEEGDIITIGPMSNAQGQQLLLNKLGQHIDQDGTLELAAYLESFPLALVQAATYIRNRLPRFSVRESLDELRKSDANLTSLLSQSVIDLRRDREGINAIFSTWQDSFDHLRWETPSAVDLLSLIALFGLHCIPTSPLFVQGPGRWLQSFIIDLIDSDPIETNTLPDGSTLEGFGEDATCSVNLKAGTTQAPELFELAQFNQAIRGMVKRNQKRPKKATPEDEEYQFGEDYHVSQFPQMGFDSRYHRQGDFEDVILLLRDHHLVSETKDPRSVSMFRLVQLAMRDWLGLGGNVGAWRRLPIAHLYAAYLVLEGAMDERQNELEVEESNALFTHTWSLISKHFPLEGDHPLLFEEWIWRVLDFGATILHKQKRWTDEKELLLRALCGRRRRLGEANPETIECKLRLGHCYIWLMQWQKAEEMFSAFLQTQREQLESENLKILEADACLAYAYHKQLKYKEAIIIFNRLLDTQERLPALYFSKAVGYLSEVSSERHDKYSGGLATPLAEKYLKYCTQTLGCENPDTLQAMHWYARILYDTENFDQALVVVEDCFTLQKIHLGKKHPDTLRTMYLLGLVCNELPSHCSQASVLLERCLEIQTQVLERDHLDTLRTMRNYAFILTEQKDWGKALPLCKECFELQTQVFGREHAHTLESMYNYVQSLSVLVASEEALPLLKECWELHEKVFGWHHEDTLETMYWYARALGQCKRYVEAIPLLEGYVEQQTEILESDHPETESAIEWLELCQAKTLLSTSDTQTPSASSRHRRTRKKLPVRKKKWYHALM